MGQEGPQPANQTARMAGASGGGGAQSFTDVHTSLAGHTAWLGARQLGSPWQAGVGLQPAFLLSQSVEQSTEPAACTPAAPPLPPRHPGGHPRHCKSPRKQARPPPHTPGPLEPGTQGHLHTRWGWKGGNPGPLQPSPCLYAADGSQWRLESPPPPASSLPEGTVASSSRPRTIPPLGKFCHQQERRGKRASSPARCLPPSCPSRRSPSSVPRARNSPVYRRRN